MQIVQIQNAFPDGTFHNRSMTCGSVIPARPSLADWRFFIALVILQPFHIFLQ